MTIDPKTTAVVLIEYQNDFASEGGALHGAVEEVMDKINMLDNTKRVVDAARAAGVTVMHAPITFAEGYGELSAHPYGILKGGRRWAVLRQGQLGSSLHRRAGAAAGRHRDRGQARLGHLRRYQPRLHSPQQGHQDDRPRRLSHQLLRRVDDANGLRARLPGGDTHRLHGSGIARTARQCYRL